MKAECALLRPRLRRERSSTAENRLGAYLPALGATRRAFGGERALASLRAATGESGLALSDYPAEVRLYPVGGAMAWHRDEQLYEAPQVEGVLTVANSSDSETEWLDAAGRLHSLWTEPNSLLLVRAQGALHRVRGVGRGERAIVKVVLTTEAGSPRLAAYESTLATTYDA